MSTTGARRIGGNVVVGNAVPLAVLALLLGLPLGVLLPIPVPVAARVAASVIVVFALAAAALASRYPAVTVDLDRGVLSVRGSEVALAEVTRAWHDRARLAEELTLQAGELRAPIIVQGSPLRSLDESDRMLLARAVEASSVERDDDAVLGLSPRQIEFLNRTTSGSISRSLTKAEAVRELIDAWSVADREVGRHSDAPADAVVLDLELVASMRGGRWSALGLRMLEWFLWSFGALGVVVLGLPSLVRAALGEDRLVFGLITLAVGALLLLLGWRTGRSADAYERREQLALLARVDSGAY